MRAATLFVVAAGPVLIVFTCFLCILAAGLFLFDAVLVLNSTGALPQCVLIV